MEKKKILIVDDEENFAYIVKMNLEQCGGYDVTVETRAANALNAANLCNPHLILLDIIMPDKDGFEVLEMLKKNNRTASIPVIIL